MDNIKELLDNGADSNTKDNNGFTLLMNYAVKNDLESMQILLDYAARINDKDEQNYTALDYAIKYKNLNAVKLLVNNGATVSSDIYMHAVRTNNRLIINFFDSLDPEKYIFLKKKK